MLSFHKPTSFRLLLDNKPSVMNLANLERICSHGDMKVPNFCLLGDIYIGQYVFFVTF